MTTPKAKPTTLDGIKLRIIKDHLAQLVVFSPPKVIANIMGTELHQITEWMDDGTISYIVVRDVTLICLVTLMEELEWHLSKFYTDSNATGEIGS